MIARGIALVAVLATVAGCARVAESRFNPFNWFGNDREITTTAPEVIADPRPLVAQVSSITIDPAPGGAILRAVGLPPRQGHFEGDLVVQPATAGVLAFQFRVVPPFEPTRVSTDRSRELVVARFLSDQTLQGIREIQVFGAENARAVRR